MVNGASSTHPTICPVVWRDMVIERLFTKSESLSLILYKYVSKKIVLLFQCDVHLWRFQRAAPGRSAKICSKYGFSLTFSLITLADDELSFQLIASRIAKKIRASVIAKAASATGSKDDVAPMLKLY